jgi:hypothetical protein
LNKADAARLEWVHDQPCVACTMNLTLRQGLRATGMRVEAHHLVDKGYRKHSGGHQATLPLCEWHHRGEQLPGLSGGDMICLYGPPLTRKRWFQAKYGFERQLLAQVDLTHSGAAPVSSSQTG